MLVEEVCKTLWPLSSHFQRTLICPAFQPRRAGTQTLSVPRLYTSGHPWLIAAALKGCRNCYCVFLVAQAVNSDVFNPEETEWSCESEAEGSRKPQQLQKLISANTNNEELNLFGIQDKYFKKRKLAILTFNFLTIIKMNESKSDC